ncbi:hypothetical protein FE257_006675 [Aspergillus nanangensis]|uniref:N-acetyltransferase domain-containing protein n=1 Tax=Aspergillus nanangensis TaxID=2582783 RepID=A0AAD4CNY3_ASPNN|nr:hypothetical protein FE257_006675 [Aspergillus nanangensis]
MTQTTTIAPMPRSYASHVDQNNILLRYKTLRLTGLQQDPQAFSSTYEKEVEFSDEKWVARITNPEAKTFIALTHNINQTSSASTIADSPVDELLSSDWVGTVTCLGPKILLTNSVRSCAPWKVFVDPDADREQGDGETKITLYMLAGMLVLRCERRRGHGRRLIEHAVKDVCGEAEKASVDRVVLLALVDANNGAACATYKCCGFEVWDEEVLLESRDGVERSIAMALDIKLKGECG